MKLKSISCINYCGYPELSVDLDPNFSLFIGENGVGKSSLLEAIRLLSGITRLRNRKNDMFFRKLIRHPDYDPSYEKFQPATVDMSIEGVFTDGEKDYKVRIESNAHNRETDGIAVNELPDSQLEYALFTDSDNPMNLQKFQIRKESAEKFLDLAQAIYGYECRLEKEVSEWNNQEGRNISFYTDFIIYKDYAHTNVHFRRMSAGERKIATLLAELTHPENMEHMGIYLIDNFSMHVYYQRHKIMVDKFFEHFPNNQIIATDHSGVVIDYMKEKYGDKHVYDIKDLLKFPVNSA